VILVAALIIVGGNYSLMKGLTRDLLDQRPTDTTAGRSAQPTGAKPVVIGMMPKAKGDTYFIACHKGAEEAAKELGVTLLWDGPTDPDPAKQNEIVDTWITRGVDVIAVSVQNGDGLSTALRKARAHGIKVITWDADANPDARDFFINQGTFQDIGFTLMDNAARILGNKGSFAIITASLTDANQNQWMKFIEQRRQEKYPDIRMVTVLPSDGQQTKAAEQTKAILNSSPEVKLIMAIAAPAVPGAAEAVKQSGRTDVKVMGLSLPNLNKSYIHSGVTDCIVLWNTMDLGYLTVYASDAVATGKLKQGDSSMDGGRLGKIKVDGDTIMLGQPFVFNKDNIDGFDF
jgi:rhamnose transport system permease protein